MKNKDIVPYIINLTFTSVGNPIDGALRKR